MKEVMVRGSDKIIFANELEDHQLIIAKKGDKPCGMISKEESGFIHKIDCACGCSGYFDTIFECIRASEIYGYKFYVV